VAKLFVAATLPGWMGVNLFFVLSGFLITGILLDSKWRTDYFRRFYYRRALRILPIYYAVLALLAVLPRLGLVDRKASWGFLAFCCIYLANFTVFFGVPMQYGVLWTLAIEEHFSLRWPALVKMLSRRNVVAAATAIFFLCPMLRWLYVRLGWEMGDYTWIYADGLALGAVLAALIRGPWGSRRGMWRIAALLGSVSLTLFAGGFPYGIFLASRHTGLVLRYTALNLFFGSLISLALLVGTSKWRALVNRPILQFFGAISYGVYLIHMLVFDLVDHLIGALRPSLAATSGHFGLILFRFCIGAGGTVVLAYASRWYFEEFFLRLKEDTYSSFRTTQTAQVRS
jgi:peptidoglycan/LPS O-acetylase OafA/YrhL